MLIWNGIGTIILFGILLSIFYFTLERLLVANFIFNKNIPIPIIEILQGFIYASLFIIMQLIKPKLYVNFQVPLFFIGALVLVTIKNPRVACLSILPSFIYFLIKFPITHSTFLLIGGIFFSMIVYVISSAFFKEFYSKIFSFVIFGLIGIILSLVAIYVFQNEVNFVLQSILFTFMATIFLDILLLWAIRISISANILYESVNYAFRTFVREHLKNNIIGNRIINKKIVQGIYGLFDFDFPDQISNKKNNEIKESILVDIELTFPQHTILFQSDETKYGFFLPIQYLGKKSQSTNLVNLTNIVEMLLQKASKTYKTTYGTKVAVKIYAGISIYGTQENSLNKLNHNAHFALRTLEKEHNHIHLFNPKIYRKKMRDFWELEGLAQMVNLNNYNNEFMPIYNLQIQKTQFLFLNQSNNVEEQFATSTREYIRNLGLIEVFDRYLAAIALSLFKKKTNLKIMLLYSPSIFEGEFYIKEFIRQINKSHLTTANVVLCIDLDDLNVIKNFQKVLHVINALKDCKIKFALLNFHGSKIKQIEQIQFSYLIISAQQLEQINQTQLNKVFNNAQIIIKDLNSEDALFKLNTKRFHLISGNLFNSNSFPTLFDKQSKMYLEEILKRKEP